MQHLNQKIDMRGIKYEDCKIEEKRIKQQDPGNSRWREMMTELIEERGIVNEIKQSRAAQYSTVQYSTLQYSTVESSTVQSSTVQYSTVHYSTEQYRAEQYSRVQYSTLQYSTEQSWIEQIRANKKIKWKEGKEKKT